MRKDIAQLERLCLKAWDKAIEKAKERGGIYENFGQAELIKVKDTKVAQRVREQSYSTYCDIIESLESRFNYASDRDIY